jgi:multidrug resistance efflux pump
MAGTTQEGRLLRLAPAWAGYAYWVVGATAFGIVALLSTVDVREYAAGPAIVRLEGRLDLTARVAGTASAVFVRPGQRVERDQALVALHDEAEGADLDRIRREFDARLAKLLRDPGDAEAQTALASLRAQRELARARVAERLVRAPQTGWVSDVRTRPGQFIAPGDIVASMATDDTRATILAVLPGSHRPMLRPGMELRLEVAGFPFAYQKLRIEWVGDEVIGPAEVRRHLGPGVGDGLAPAGASVLVRAVAAAKKFDVGGQSYAYFDGMVGKAEVPVRSELAILALMPSLRLLWGAHGAR